MYKCPYPGCGYIAAYAILNSHARKHGFKTVKELTKAYGPIKQPNIDPVKLRHANEMSINITENSFNNIESAVLRMKQENRSDLRNR